MTRIGDYINGMMIHLQYEYTILNCLGSNGQGMRFLCSWKYNNNTFSMDFAKSINCLYKPGHPDLFNDTINSTILIIIFLVNFLACYWLHYWLRASCSQLSMALYNVAFIYLYHGYSIIYLFKVCVHNM